VSLGRLQEEFSVALGALLIEAGKRGKPFRCGELLRTPEQAAVYAAQKKGSLTSVHIIRLAFDGFVIKDGALSNDPEVYRELGDFWKTLHPLARWGGDFKPPAPLDPYHFSFEYQGRK
jgi:hypothetical protein